MSQPLHRRVVPETYVQLLYDYLKAHGHDPVSVLEEPWPQPDPNGAGGVDVEHWEHMLAMAARQLGDPLLGIHLGRTISARHFGVLGSVLLACNTLEAALARLERYLRLVFDVLPMYRREGQGWVEIVWDTSEYQPGPLVNETGIVAMVQFCRDLVVGAVDPIQIDFNHQGPTDPGPYEEFFGCPVRFAQAQAVMRFAPDVLAMPLKSPDPALITLLEQHADRLLAQLPQQDEMVEQVRKTISRELHEGEPSIERIGARLRLSPRTLQRRLQETGTTFRGELNLVRHELALSYLRDPRLQIVDIAMLLGYSEHSAFTRAFKEWSGQTPLEARQNQRS
ncbi:MULTISPECIES: AraC family transcriptional regulator [Pseudomonas]|uniref:AraC family transcriptional regulator n=1 Tax=Pseudomonas TaxID=286 RepID=UPI0003B437DC|nr:AraC family transcriptional regulator [Pseudomonas piscis]ERO65708.1 hypothetical protein P308_18290 [Pseudomonas piscis]